MIKTQVLAHRGASCCAPENTLEAFSQAASEGADGIELDVHLSADGHLVVIHDDTLERTTNGIGAVNSRSLSELRSLDASAGMAAFSGAKIPTLDEVYTLLKPTGLFINVEIKEDTVVNGMFPVICKVLALTEQFDMEDRVFYSSFNHYILHEIKRCNSRIQTGILYAAALVNVWDYACAVPSDAIHPNFEVLRDKNVIEQCHKSGIKVRPWTVNCEENLQNLFQQGADAVITNDPHKALQIRADYCH